MCLFRKRHLTSLVVVRIKSIVIDFDWMPLIFKPAKVNLHSPLRLSKFISREQQHYSMIKSVFALSLCAASAVAQDTPTFEAQVIDGNIAIGYGVAIGDVDGDKKADILLADKKQFVWYRNGDWKRFVIAENLTEFDNVCIAARDIDGDGRVEVAVGAQWNPSETSDTTKSGSVHYLIRPKDPTKLWKPVKLHHEPTVHRMRWVQIAKDRYNLVVVPLHGRGNKNGEGDGVRIFAYEMPKDPAKKWKYTLVDQSMHLTHNFDIVQRGPEETIVVAGKEGLRVFNFQGRKNSDSDLLVKDKGFGEVRVSSGNGVAGISPMHGNELNFNGSIVISSDLNQGHALGMANLVGDAVNEIIAGWREPNKQNKVGIKIFVKQKETTTAKWDEYWIDDNGMACEDLQLADLNGDGKIDIIASGRSTHNLKIYWNKN
jgi:hypothetical protein